MTLKLTKQREEDSASKEKAPSGSGSAKKSLFHERTEIDLNIFMAQMLDSMQKLHTKVDNVVTRLLFIEKKMREMKKEMSLLRKGKEDWKTEEKEEDEDEENEGDRGENENEKEKESEKEKEEAEKKGQEEEGVDQGDDDSDEDDFFKTESDTTPALLRTTGLQICIAKEESKEILKYH